MTTSREAERLPLTGADGFLRAFDAETRRWSAASHLSQLVLRLGPGFEADALEAVLARMARANPILTAPIRRSGGLGAPVYRLDLGRRAPPPRVARHAPWAPGDDPLAPPPLFAARLSEIRSARRGELLRVDAVPRPAGAADPGGTDLAFTWLHMLFDGAGSEGFVQLLEDCRRGARTPDGVPEADRPGAPPDLPLPASARERGGMARAWQARMQALGARSVRSPSGPLRRLAQDLRVDRRVFPAPQSEGICARAARLAGALTPMLFYMAAAIRAHDVVLRARGARPESYAIPLPVDLRPKGKEGGIFRTRVSMLWLQVPAERADDLEDLLAALKEARRRAIRENMVAKGVAAMDFARWAPARLYARMARRTLGGELCSFFFAWTDAFCPDLSEFFGAEVLDGFHAPAVPPSPGSALVFSLREGRLQITHVRQHGVLAPDERAAMGASLERDLCGERGAAPAAPGAAAGR